MNNFLVYRPICMKFAPNSSVLEIRLFWLGFTVSDPFPLREFYGKYHELVDPNIMDVSRLISDLLTQ